MLQRRGIESGDGAALFARTLNGFRHQIRRVPVQSRRVEGVIGSMAFQAGREFRSQQRQARYRAVRLRHAPPGQKRHGQAVQTRRNRGNSAKKCSGATIIGEHAPAQPQNRPHAQRQRQRTQNHASGQERKAHADGFQNQDSQRQKRGNYRGQNALNAFDMFLADLFGGGFQAGFGADDFRKFRFQREFLVRVLHASAGEQRAAGRSIF